MIKKCSLTKFTENFDKDFQYLSQNKAKEDNY